MTFPTKNTFSIGDTAKMTGATQKQIRHWEAKGYIPEAGRVVSGDQGLSSLHTGSGGNHSPDQRISGRRIHPFGRRAKSDRYEISTKEGKRHA